MYISLISLSSQEETGGAADAINENKEFPDGMTDVEVGKRLAEVWISISYELNISMCGLMISRMWNIYSEKGIASH